MTLKKFGALLLAGAMMTGTLGVMSPTQAKAAAPANTYTMEVPANVDIQKSGWNALGDIKITGSVDTGKKVTVTASTTNNFALKNGNNSVSYTLKKAENDTNTTTSFEFDAASIKAEGGASQTIGVDVEDFAGTPAGTYTDTITFTGTMSEDSLMEAMAAFSGGYALVTYSPLEKYQNYATNGEWASVIKAGTIKPSFVWYYLKNTEGNIVAYESTFSDFKTEGKTTNNGNSNVIADPISYDTAWTINDETGLVGNPSSGALYSSPYDDSYYDVLETYSDGTMLMSYVDTSSLDVSGKTFTRKKAMNYLIPYELAD